MFLFVGVGLPFWPVWFADQGISAAGIGILLSLSGWTKIVGNPLIAQLADRCGDVRAVLIGAAVASLATFALFGVTDGILAVPAGDDDLQPGHLGADAA